MAKVLGLLAIGLFFGNTICFSQTADSTQVLSPEKTTSAEVKYYLVLDKPGKVSRIRFYTGNKINFKLTGEKQRYSGQITNIKKYSIVMWDAEIPLRDIRKIRMASTSTVSSGVQFLGRLLKNGGLFFSVVGGGNYLLDKEPGDNTLTFLKYTLGAFVAGQLLTHTSRSRTYKINENHRLKTIEQFW
ncbi:hypothetical protein AHMF7605_12950 [Adhaeribacter arboris]|uniref:DUF4369 domain-containing protein n=1 Tax=Adhaeribacter arboris TaxID=2072846 RepID=A0A2T2YFR0_9BACT|nr:hypothetical protein [Adhaeribacter arboris]PSR54355.1 hypothetical protein AHMF7605_12950 [Adhaeribacter arboris]